MNKSKTTITISDVMEYHYCPRFTYFMHVLDIPQHEEMRFKVLKGREVHEKKKHQNISYLRKKLEVKRKLINVFLSSEKYQIRGIIDELLILTNGEIVPFEFKFAEYKERLFQTYKSQLVIQALLIQENYDVTVTRGFICFTRTNNIVKEVQFTINDFRKVEKTIKMIISIIETGIFPKMTQYNSRCIDCCYRNICVR